MTGLGAEIFLKKDKRKCVCFISRGTPEHGLESLIKREYFYYKYFAENFDHPIFLDVSKVFTSQALSKGDVDEAAHRLLPAKWTIIIPNSFADFKNFLKSNAMIVISNFSEEWYDWYIHYYLKKYKIPLIYIHTMSENTDFQIQNLSKFKFRFLGKTFEILKKAYFRLEEHLFCAKVDTLFISNPQQAHLHRRSSRFNEIVLTNSRFYDSYLANSYPVTDNCIVFLDSMVPYHFDQARYGFPLTDRELYYFNLDRVFNVIEQKLSKKVVVCLHPKYNDENVKKDFGQRQTVKHRTQEFTAKAAVVLFHESSAVNHAVLYNKKVIQLIGSRFNDFINSNCKSIQRILGCPTLDMYEDTQEPIGHLLDTLKINKEKYEIFLSNYIVRPGEEGVFSCRQIADHIKLKYMRG